jgi:plastocyanin domain-containing protein
MEWSGCIVERVVRTIELNLMRATTTSASGRWILASGSRGWNDPSCDETTSCSEEVVFGDFGIARALPAFQTPPIEYTPGKVGAFTFTCGTNILRGTLLVEEA